MSVDFDLGIDLARFASGRTKYEALREHFIAQFQSGRLHPGAALPTEQALAETAGVARSTVRQAMAALERDGLIRRVQGKGTFVREDAARRLHESSQTAVALFALIVPETRTGFYPPMLHGFETASSETHHQAIICKTDNNVDRQGNAILQLIDKRVAGVAIVPTTNPTTPAYQIRQLQQHQIPVVFFHRSVEGLTAPLLALPHEKIGELAGKRIAKHGHRQVAYIASHRSKSAESYCRGLRTALADAGVELREEDIWWPESNSPEVQEQEIQAALESMYSRDERPTAIFASFDSVAEVVYFKLTQSLGLRVPEDVSLIGVGGTWRGGVITRRLTSVVIDEVAAARRAVELLVEMQQGKRPLYDDERYELPVNISDGETLCHAPR